MLPISIKPKEWKAKIGSFIARTGFYFLLAVVLLCLSALLIDVKKYELLPATLFSAITALFSYWAYKFSEDKFRLDLFDKRWEVYEHTLEFCSLVTQQGTLKITQENRDQIVAAIKAAGNSFRGTGWHKTRALFGEEIHSLFEQLNQSYAWLSANSDRPSNPSGSVEWAQKMYDNSMFIWNTVQTLPDIFKPYIYFGDYKNSAWSMPINKNLE